MNSCTFYTHKKVVGKCWASSVVSKRILTGPWQKRTFSLNFDLHGSRAGISLPHQLLALESKFLHKLPRMGLHWSLEKPELAFSQVSPPATPWGMVTVGHRLTPRERKRPRMNFKACTCGIMAQGKVLDLPNPKQGGNQAGKGLPGQTKCFSPCSTPLCISISVYIACPGKD